MSLKEKVKGMFDAKHKAGYGTNEEKAITKELDDILQEALGAGNFKISSMVIDKASVYFRIVNDKLSIPIHMGYKEVELPSFQRKPGKKQAAAREQEVLAKITPEEVLSSHKFAVGTSYYEVSKSTGWITFVHGISVI